MTRPRLTDTHPLFEELMKRHEVDTIKDLSKKTGIPYMTLMHLSDPRGQKLYRKILEYAQRLDIEPGTWISELSRDLTENNHVK